jgi:hypothetical protein
MNAGTLLRVPFFLWLVLGELKVRGHMTTFKRTKVAKKCCPSRIIKIISGLPFRAKKAEAGL